MIKNYFKIAFRSLYKNRLYSLINIIGLAAALMCCIYIVLFVNHEWSYDSFYTDSTDIYRISLDINLPDGESIKLSSAPAPVAPLIVDLYTQISRAARLKMMSANVTSNNILFRGQEFRLVDEHFFSIFDFQWLAGEKERGLTDPNSVVLTQSSAERYFGNENPVGKTLQVNEDLLLTVTGLIADLPSNSHLTGELFSSFALANGQVPEDNTWYSSNYYTYVLLENDTDVAQLEAQFPSLLEEYADIPPGVEYALVVMPVTDIHLQSRNINEISPPGNPWLIYSVLAIGFGIFIIAGFNFVNISTAQATRKELDVGVRKVLGASRSQLIMQYLTENVILCSIAMLLAVAAVEMFMQVFNQIAGISIEGGLFGSPYNLMCLVITAIILGIVAGWYPSLFLSSSRPSFILNGWLPLGHQGVYLRSVLVVLQFSIVIVLLAVTVSIQSQLAHVNRLELGFQEEDIVVVGAYAEDFGEKYESFRNTLLQNSTIQSVSSSITSPLGFSSSFSVFHIEGETTVRTLPLTTVDQNFFGLYGVPFLAGRNFSPDMLTDRSSENNEPVNGSIIINEQAARVFGWTPEESIGRTIQDEGDIRFNVIGVVGNTVTSAKESIQPIVFKFPEAAFAGSQISISIVPSNSEGSLAVIDRVWNTFFPSEPIQREFMSGKINALYINDQKQLSLVFMFAILSMIIASMGLFGLASFNTETRKKEIGVRKVMGGSVWNIVLLLTNDFSKLVLLSNIIAWPVAFFVMSRWLENFAYRIDLTPLIFVGSGLIALCIAWVTVGGTAAKAASQKPVLALRYE